MTVSAISQGPWYQELGILEEESDKVFRLNGHEYVLNSGILKLRDPRESQAQDQTSKYYSFLWKNGNPLDSEVWADRMTKALQRQCGEVMEDLMVGLPEGAKVLDAGCASGAMAQLLFEQKYFKKMHYLGVDISDAVYLAQKQFAERDCPGEFVQTNLNKLPIPEASLDLIVSLGVLHHTDSTEESIKNLSRHLVSGGRFLFWVYNHPPLIRSKVEPIVREAIKDMSDEEAFEELMPLTKMGVEMSKVNFEVPEDIPILGIKAGKYNLQTFFYDYVLRQTYYPDTSLVNSNLNTFDWYRPLNSHFQSPEEVEGYCKNAGLEITWMKSDANGVSVLAKKN